MSTYIILSKLKSGAFTEPKEFKELAAEVTRKIATDCPGVAWKESFAAMGRYDVIDIVEADDLLEVQKAAMVIRAFGCATTETLVVTPWHDFVGRL